MLKFKNKSVPETPKYIPFKDMKVGFCFEVDIMPGWFCCKINDAEYLEVSKGRNLTVYVHQYKCMLTEYQNRLVPSDEVLMIGNNI